MDYGGCGRDKVKVYYYRYHHHSEVDSNQSAPGAAYLILIWIWLFHKPMFMLMVITAYRWLVDCTHPVAHSPVPRREDQNRDALISMS